MKHTFTIKQIKTILAEELRRSEDEEQAKDLLRKLIGLNEDEADDYESNLAKARKFSKYIGISLVAAVAILFGGMGMLSTTQKKEIQLDIEKVQSVDDETLQKFGVDTGELYKIDLEPSEEFLLYPTEKLGLKNLSDMSNREKVEAAWGQIDDMIDSGELFYNKARVSTRIPGGMVALDYDAIPADMILPNSLATKNQYRAWLVTNILKADVKNLPKLKDFVYGNTGKWPSGSGEDSSRYHEGAQVLPPEWTVALDLYQDTVNAVVQDLATAYREGDAETKQQILDSSGVSSAEELEKVLNSTLKSAGL